MDWLFSVCVFVSLAGYSSILLSQNISQDGHAEERDQDQKREGHLAKTGPPVTRAETQKSFSQNLKSIESLNAEALAYQDKGQYSQAEPLFLQALTLCEQYPEPDQPLILVTTLNNLSRLYYDQGRYPDMEPPLRRALTLGEKALGSEHVAVAVTLDNWAYLHVAPGSL
jgi:tetratricopeptide (TPR) repeat protein